MSFRSLRESAILHDPSDQLDNSKIPMKPDRVIGMSVKDKYQPFYENHTQSRSNRQSDNVNIICPFLVVEAKRAQNVPGFGAIEMQTSFPIRRFLMAQKILSSGTGSKTKLEPLVWFFANQGELWKVYAGTLDEKEIVVRVLPSSVCLVLMC